MNMPHELLPSLVLYPLIAGAVCLILPDKVKNIIKIFAFLVTLACLAGTTFIFLKKPVSWQAFDLNILVADNLSGFVGLAVAFFASLIALYSCSFIKISFGRYFGYFLISLGASLGVVFANDLLALLLFWGLLAAMLYLMVNLKDTPEAAAAAKKALIIIGGTDALMMFGIALLWLVTGTFSMDKIQLPLNGIMNIAAFACLLAASFAKSGVMPFHSWLPDVAEEAPATVSAFLPASLDKLLGIYLLARISLNIFVMNKFSNLVLLAVGSMTIVFAVTIALVQHDFKRLLGYHAVSQVGYMVLGIGTGSAIGIAGGLFHMLNNAIYKSCLFLNGGAVEKKTGTSDLAEMGGLAKYMPITFASCLVASLAISGVPPFNGFVSKWMIYQGIIGLASPKNPLWIVWLVSAMFGSALTVASFMKLLHASFMGRASKDYSTVKEAGPAMTIPMILLAILCAVFGIFSFSIPLSIFIIPSIGKSVSYSGIWDPAAATVLLILGLLLGLAVYLFLKPRTFRSVKAFVGGEDADGLGRISGVDFYETIKSMDLFKFFYKNEEAKFFDVYEQGNKLLKPLTKAMQFFHNGILPTYMVWCLLGMVGMFLLMFMK